MQRDVFLPSIVLELERENLLPAIVFRTARAQCDADIGRIIRNRSLDVSRSTQVAIKSKIYEVIHHYQMDEELIVDHPHYEALLTTGIGAHHAGQLLMWRLLLEELMQAGLLRVLVATGTVAAGVDFPARTVVITAHSRRGSEGFQTYTSSEFQQMSGRAGRRGKDTVGFCIVSPSRFCDGRAVLDIAKRPPEPLVSAYYPSPSTVLNLLRYRNADDLVYTVERSLAAFVDRKEALKLKEEAQDVRAQLGNHTKLHGGQHEGNSVNVADESLDYVDSDMQDGNDVDSHTKSAVLQVSDSKTAKKQRKKAKRLERQAQELEERQVTLLNKVIAGLTSLGYIEEQNLSPKGHWASNICTNIVLELGEVVESGIFVGASPEKFVAIVASIAGDPYRRYLQSKGGIFSDEEFDTLKTILTKVRGLGIPGVLQGGGVIVDAAHTALIWMHANSWQEFRGLISLVGVQEGDVARLITQTSEHLNQLMRLSDSFPELAKKAELAKLRILRPPLTEGLDVISYTSTKN